MLTKMSILAIRFQDELRGCINRSLDRHYFLVFKKLELWSCS